MNIEFSIRNILQFFVFLLFWIFFFLYSLNRASVLVLLLHWKLIFNFKNMGTNGTHLRQMISGNISISRTLKVLCFLTNIQISLMDVSREICATMNIPRQIKYFFFYLSIIINAKIMRWNRWICSWRKWVHVICLWTIFSIKGSAESISAIVFFSVSSDSRVINSVWRALRRRSSDWWRRRNPRKRLSLPWINYRWWSGDWK